MSALRRGGTGASLPGSHGRSLQSLTFQVPKKKPSPEEEAVNLLPCGFLLSITEPSLSRAGIDVTIYHPRKRKNGEESGFLFSGLGESVAGGSGEVTVSPSCPREAFYGH